MSLNLTAIIGHKKRYFKRILDNHIEVIKKWFGSDTVGNEICMRDPVHNYIYLTDVEAIVVKHPLFQRLRFISQNGAAYYTYPSNKHCRFLHSLGCLKIGGDIFLTATEDINSPTVNSFIADAYALIEEILGEAGIRLDTAITQFIDRRDKTFIKYGLLTCTDTSKVEGAIKKGIDSLIILNFTRAVVFQSIRLACALHDIGHFPFSHTVEYAFNSWIKQLHIKFPDSSNVPETLDGQFYKNYLYLMDKKYGGIDKDLHERIGLKILDEVIPSDTDSFHKICRLLAKKILIKTTEPIVVALNKLVSGELDADRLDYSLRDPISSGLELGRFDVERLVNSFELIKIDNSYEFLPKIQALSAVESFYHQRYLVYKYLIYHHNKVRMDLIIQKITLFLINCYFNQNSTNEWITTILKQYKFSNLWSKVSRSTGAPKGYEDYYLCDENWYKSLLARIFDESRDQQIRDSEIEKLMLLIRSFLLRDTNNMLSLIKRYDQYLEFLQFIFEQISAIHKDVEFNDDFKRNCFGVIETLISSGEMEKFSEESYKTAGILVLYKLTPPKLYKDNDLNLVLKDGSKVPVSKLSPYMVSLNYLTFSDQLFQFFLVKQDIKNESTVKINVVRDQLIELIKMKYLEVII